MHSRNFLLLAINGGACNFLLGKRWVDLLLFEAFEHGRWSWATEYWIPRDLQFSLAFSYPQGDYQIVPYSVVFLFLEFSFVIKQEIFRIHVRLDSQAWNSRMNQTWNWISEFSLAAFWILAIRISNSSRYEFPKFLQANGA